MVQIGKPTFARRNSAYSKISMRPKEKPPSNGRPESNIEIIRRVTGHNPEGVKFVDGKTHNKIGKDEFLKLMTHQLSNQDPMKPMDQHKFAADLAQFAQLEQLTNINKGITNNNNNQVAEKKFFGISFLGKKVRTSGSTIDYPGDGGFQDIPVYLQKDARNILVRLYDSKNQLIAQIEKDQLSHGNHSITWNGISLDGSPAIKDKYHVEVRAWDNEFNEFKGETKSYGIVSNVSFENGEIILTLDGKKKVFLRDVESFGVVSHNKRGMGHNPVKDRNGLEQYKNMVTR
jgi:flagellar basal-body rod modification protein FlgD